MANKLKYIPNDDTQISLDYNSMNQPIKIQYSPQRLFGGLLVFLALQYDSTGVRVYI